MAVLKPALAHSGYQSLPDGPDLEKPVDLVHLARMTMGDRSLEREVLGLFRSQASLCLARLRKAEDEVAFIEAAHAIKGSARGIGAWRVADIAATLQDEGLPALAEGKVEALAEVLAEVDGYIARLLCD